ncbi:DUF397 domain-containing protein [Actinacidiphila yeochonensis]|uniref:DUF397 domain-containing protein n=1 Tax=Actinacidiphila yeochonensis TaxID=89050 RepID=UPI00055AC3C6|nr:DUF397 domain-containing protein [Actinacidiphila yeochonensis]
MTDNDLTTWRKSSYSGGNGNCVEVAVLDGVVAMRDSKNPDGPTLQFTPAAFAAFLTAVATDGLR